MRCSGVIKLCFKDDGIVLKILIRGHEMSEVIKIYIKNFGSVLRFYIGGILHARIYSLNKQWKIYIVGILP